MSRLPRVGGDAGNWGSILNEFLSVEHNADGTLKKSSDITDAKSKANAAQPLSEKGQAGGYAPLDSSARISSLNLPYSNHQIFDVRQFGAKCDGATDDTTAVQNAINAAESIQGGTVFFPGGVTIVRTLTHKGAVMLKGTDGWGSTIKLKNGTNASLIATNSLNTTYYGGVRDLVLDGNKANNSGNSDCIELCGAERYFIDHCLIKNAKRHGINLYGTIDNTSIQPTVTGCYIVDCDGNGIVAGSYASDVLIHTTDIGRCQYGIVVGSAVVINGGALWGNQVGLLGYWSTGTTVRGTRIDYSSYSGVSLVGCTGFDIDAHIYHNSQAASNTYSGVKLEGTVDHPTTRCRIAGLIGDSAGMESQKYGIEDDGGGYVDYINIKSAATFGNMTGDTLLTGSHNVT